MKRPKRRDRPAKPITAGVVADAFDSKTWVLASLIDGWHGLKRGTIQRMALVLNRKTPHLFVRGVDFRSRWSSSIHGPEPSIELNLAGYGKIHSHFYDALDDPLSESVRRVLSVAFDMEFEDSDTGN